MVEQGQFASKNVDLKSQLPATLSHKMSWSRLDLQQPFVIALISANRLKFWASHSQNANGMVGWLPVYRHYNTLLFLDGSGLWWIRERLHRRTFGWTRKLNFAVPAGIAKTNTFRGIIGSPQRLLLGDGRRSSGRFGTNFKRWDISLGR